VHNLARKSSFEAGRTLEIKGGGGGERSLV
jgi:hypothetical protein